MQFSAFGRKILCKPPRPEGDSQTIDTKCIIVSLIGSFASDVSENRTCVAKVLIDFSLTVKEAT